MDKTGYTFDPTTKVLTGTVGIQESPLEPGVWLMPPNTTEVPPLPPQVDKSVAFVNGTWVYTTTIPGTSLPQEPVEDVRQTMVVSRFQGRAALLNAGLLNEVEAYFNSTSATQLEKLAWEDVLQFERVSPLVLKMGQLLGQTDAQLDQLFQMAAMIRV